MAEINERDPELLPIADVSDWDVEIDGAVVRPRLGATISLRLDPEMARRVRKAAKLIGVSQSDFIRQAASQRAESLLGSGVEEIIVAPGSSISVRLAPDGWQTVTTTPEASKIREEPKLDWSHSSRGVRLKRRRVHQAGMHRLRSGSEL
jgi:hypothetical protein